MTDISDRIPSLNKKVKHTIEAVVDRLTVKRQIRTRLSDSVETALEIGDGTIIVSRPEISEEEDVLFSEHNTCVKCGISFERLAPRNFSFNSPYGACRACNGLGNKMEIDPELIVPDGNEPVIRAVVPWKRGGKGIVLHFRRQIRRLARHHGFDHTMPYRNLTAKQKKMILYGDPASGFEGVIPNLERRFHQTESDYMKEMIGSFMSVRPCPVCKGHRLNAESLAVLIKGRNISRMSEMSIAEAKTYFSEMNLDPTEQRIAGEVIKEITSRLEFMSNVGLDYLTLDRKSNTLSRGEDQRISWPPR
jgi:Excinuclease ATPase subunit